MKNEEIKSARAEAFLRIQRCKDYEKVYSHPDYLKAGCHESTFFRKRMAVPRREKRTAEAQRIINITLEDLNKGYPDNNYETFDKKHNRNYEKNNRKFRGRKTLGHPEIKIYE